jgi:hypothetical protein
VAVHEEITQDEQIQLRYQELDALEEERLHVLQNLELYRQNMVRAYDKLVKRRVLRKGELVLVLQRPIVVTHKTRGSSSQNGKDHTPSSRHTMEVLTSWSIPKEPGRCLQSTEGF